MVRGAKKSRPEDPFLFHQILPLQYEYVYVHNSKQGEEEERPWQERCTSILKQPKRYPCPHCSKVFTTPFGVKRHCKQRHDNAQPQIRYLCDFPECGRLYRRKSDAVRHKKLHVVEKPALCNRWSCEFGSLIAHVLENHKKQDHGTLPYVCKIAGCPHAAILYSSEWELQQHRQKYHTLAELYYPLWCRTKLRKEMKQKQAEWEAFLAVRQQLYSLEAFSLRRHQCQQQQQALCIIPYVVDNDDTLQKKNDAGISIPVSLLIHEKSDYPYQRRKLFRCPVPYCSFCCCEYSDFDAHQREQHDHNRNLFYSFRIPSCLNNNNNNNNNLMTEFVVENPSSQKEQDQAQWVREEWKTPPSSYSFLPRYQFVDETYPRLL